MSLPIVHRRAQNPQATPQADRMMVRKRSSHAGIIHKRQRADDDETTRRAATTAAPTRRTTEADDRTTTRPRATTTAAAAPTSAAPAPASTSAAARPSSVARAASSANVAPSRTLSGASGVAGSASASASAAAATENKSNTGMVIGVVVVAVACLAALAAFVVLRRKKRAKAAAAASRAEKAKSEEMFGNGPNDMTAVDTYRARINNEYGPGSMGAAKGGFSQSPYSPNTNEKGSRRSWEMSDDGRSYGNHSEVGLVGAAAHPGKGRHPSSNPSENTYNSDLYSPQAPPVPALDPALAAIQAVGVDQNGPNGKPGDGQIYVVKRMFEPSLSDELIIYPGDRVRIITMYDDGWCLTENLTSAAPNQAPPRGVCPRDCIDNAPLSEAELASSPISAAGGANRVSMPMPHPTLPQLQIDSKRGAPQIEVSSPDGGPYGGVNEGKQRALTPQQGGKQGQGIGPDGRPKRHSSLIASRDAELFMALGEVLEKDQGRKQ